jgi:transglutaminase-like putative cysteine protease
MRSFTRQGKTLPAVRFKAVELTSGLQQKDYSGEARALHRFVRDSIRYVRDVTDVETLHTPDVTLAQGAGDCDDKAVLVAALLEAIGHPTRFVAVGPADNNFIHVFVESKIGPNWIPIETTEPVMCGVGPIGFPARLVIHN